MPHLSSLLLCSLLCLSLSGFAAQPDAIPGSLEPWVPWVLDGKDERDCPLLPQGAGERLCAWPGRLYLSLEGDGAVFVQRWQLFADAWVPLPGDEAHWPMAAYAKDAPVPVTKHGGVPAVHLERGDWTVNGFFSWSTPPQMLAVPGVTALVSLSRDGESVEHPRRERDGRLWLRNAAAPSEPAERDAVRLQVSRLVDDGVPLRVSTRLDLHVSGRDRMLDLGSAVLPGGRPLSLSSPLPARLEPDGSLRLQLRPGHWQLDLSEVHADPVAQLTLPERAEPWPEHEVWVFKARPELRQVEVAGAEQIDPRQVRLPAAWSQLPAYRLGPGGRLELKTLHRGMAEQAPERAYLRRLIRLDLDGGGFSLRDRIRGQLSDTWRVEAEPELELGQAQISRRPSMITRLQADGAQGVEVRGRTLDLIADSRVEGRGELPVSGWSLDFSSIQARLFLPPGWRLLAVSGADNLPATWLARWSLLDLFLVLLTALVVGHLWGWRWGLVALSTLVLIWHEPGAPRLVWLYLLAGEGLLRLLSEGSERTALRRIRSMVVWYRRAVVLVLIAVPFLAQEMRSGLHPQLAQHSALDGGSVYDRGDAWLNAQGTAASGASMDAVPEGRGAVAMQKSAGILSMHSNRAEAEAQMPMASLMSAAPPPLPAEPEPREMSILDPNARVQTGPGMPSWRWRSVDLSWNGPTAGDLRLKLWLVSPALALVLAVTSTLLTLVLLVKLAGGRARLPGVVTKGAAVALLAMFSLNASAEEQAAAPQAFPPRALLEDLGERLRKPPECLPACASIPQMRLEVEDGQLRLLLRVDAAEAVAAPVPGGRGSWLPERAGDDQDKALPMRVADDGTLLLALPAGQHRIQLEGGLAGGERIELPLPLAPHRVDIGATAGWRVDGVAADGRPGSVLRLTRLASEQPNAELKLAGGALPPLLRVSRTLSIAADWSVETRIKRLSPGESPVTARVPLLPGEAVITPGRQVIDGAMVVDLAPGQSDDVWMSTLQPVERMELVAATDPRLSESWRLLVDPRWHLEREGIAPMAAQAGGGNEAPRWRPWPGERLLLTLSRPAGIEGATLTIDRSRYALTPGRRGSDAELELKLRSTRGGLHRLTLPEGAELISARRDGRELPLRQDGRHLDLPLLPRAQTWILRWQVPTPAAMMIRPAAVDLAAAGVDASVEIFPAADRWVILTGGDGVGPAVLFWSLLAVMALLAAGLARTHLTPLGMRDWLLLGVGLSQASLWAGVVVVGWLLALGLRHRLQQPRPRWRFNLIQIGLVLLTLAALAMLIAAVQQGLLGRPEMQIGGNGSHSGALRWYVDRSQGETPRVWVFSLPMIVYRGLMLAWALWLAFRLLAWLRWGWHGFSRPVLWREQAFRWRCRKSTRRRRPPTKESAPKEDAPDPTP